MEAIDRLPKGVNVGGMIGHCALRHYAMDERGLSEEPATDDDIALDVRSRRRSDGAGALGFSTSRTLLHRVPDGRPVPGTWADERELLAIADVLGRHGKGVYEVAPRFERPGASYEGTRTEVHWMAEVNRRTGRPVTFGLAQSNAGPELFRKILELVDEEAGNGGELRPQTTARGIGLLFGMQHRTFFDRAEGWQALQPLSLADRLAALDDPARRRALIAEADANTPPLDWNGVYVLHPDHVDYSADPETSLAVIALAHGESIAEAFVRISRETRGRALFNYPFLNQRMDAVEELLDHPRMAIGLGDSGAHVGLIMDASLPTWFLLHWVRDRGKYSIEDAVRRMTSDTAELFGIADRGVLRAGAFADINVFDLDELALPVPEYVHDFPAERGPVHPEVARLPHHDRQRRGVRGSWSAHRNARRSHPSQLNNSGDHRTLRPRAVAGNCGAFPLASLREIARPSPGRYGCRWAIWTAVRFAYHRQCTDCCAAREPHVRDDHASNDAQILARPRRAARGFRPRRHLLPPLLRLRIGAGLGGRRLPRRRGLLRRQWLPHHVAAARGTA